jgi:hypothetical protein
MPTTYYSRDEIKQILDETRSCWIQPYTKTEGRDIPASPSEMLDTLLDSLKDRFEIKPEEEPRRLILSLIRSSEEVARQDDLIVKRAHAMRSAFFKRFPSAPQFSDVTQIFPEYSDWKYYFTGATKEHIQWAKSAKDCGMIDNYIVDYDPEWRG